MTNEIQDVEIPELTQTINLAQEYGIELEEHEGFFNLDEVKFLVYGESGVGKTVFASTWPDCVFLDIDKGMSSVTRRVSRIPIHSIPEQSAWDALSRAIGFLESSDLHQFKTVIVDSLNEMQTISMDHIIRKFPKIRRPYDELASQSDYGKMLDDFSKAVRRLKALPMHVILVCQVAPQVYEDDVIQPQLVGKHTSRNVARMQDIVGYLYKQEGGESADKEKNVRVMVFDAVNHVTKDRSDMLPFTVENPTFAQLYERWQKQFEEKSEEE
jgi:hypothetical protein